VALDANQSLLRAYLGKAYFEEKRAPLDAEQFAIAKQLDPLDPTAYLYDAIRLQTENRPVAALREVEKSIELNDNRAVYRSRLLLDSDRAARGSSLARIYKDLGFNRLGAVEATRSLVLDPSNAAAHRFLSDLYRDVTQRTEIARVSELLQAQLLQDVNINPVQPSVSATNLNIVTRGGPAEAGFNEFTPLFERNQVRADGTLLAGTNQTASIEGVASAISGPVSLSAGGFFYDTDGFRANNDLQHDIANVFAQWAVSPGFNVQAEYRRRETEHGDLNQNFDLEDFDETFRRRRDGDVFRVGARVSPAKHSDFLVSYIHTDFESATQATLLDIPGQISLTADQAQTDEADQYEAQYIFKADAFNIVTGGAYAESDIEGQVTSTLRLTISPPLPFLPPLEIEDIRVLPTSSRTNDSRGYVYGTAKLWRSLLVTAGVSYQDFERELANNGIKNEFERWNPKLGLRWGVADNLTLRAAYFQAVKPVLVSNRTLEPTQVAGFNQFFDDSDATRSTRFGVGFDWQPLSTLHIGGELTKRELENPVVDLANLAVDYEEQTELLHRLYAYWTPSARWSLSLEGTYDNFENEQQSLVAAEVPDRVTTWTLPISAAYFDPSGWFGAAALTVVNQEVRRDEAQSDLAQGDSSFALVDAAVGYRLPKRSGVFSLSVRNLFDEDFDYQDNSYRSFGNEPYVGPYTPDRTVMARITFNF
jgi:hypothetical protein